MPDLNDIFEDLTVVEEEIEECYLKLSELENAGFLDSEEYNYYFSLLNQNINKEKLFYMNLSKSENIVQLWYSLNEKIHSEPQGIVIGRNEYSYYYRLRNALEYSIGDEVLAYVHALKTDANRIILVLINALISNPYYSDIKDSLIDFKYNLYYLNVDIEDDFLNGNVVDRAKLDAHGERTDAFLGHKYIDIAVLVYESKKIIEYLNDFNNNLEDKELYSKVVIKILMLLANLTLCDEATLLEIYEDLMSIFENDDIHPELKELLNQLMTLLTEVQDKINWSR